MERSQTLFCSSGILQRIFTTVYSSRKRGSSQFYHKGSNSDVVLVDGWIENPNITKVGLK